MRWVDRVLDQLEVAIEWRSPGAIVWRFIETENWLQIAPSLVELVGGADDGESVYPFYGLHVSHLIEMFDELPEFLWDTMNHEISLEGLIDGEDAWITFFSEPFEDEEPQDVVDPKGNIRKKNPPREASDCE